MNCDDCQNWICASLEQSPSIAPDEIVEQHLATCPACREFHQQWTSLDSQLIQRSAKAVLPEGFNTRLFAKLPAQPPRLSPAEIAQRRTQFDREYRDAVAALRPGIFGLQSRSSIRLLIVAGISVMAGILLFRYWRNLPSAGETIFGQTVIANTVLVFSYGVALAGVLYGISRASLRPFRRFYLG